MAVQKEIWLASVVAQLFASNSFMSKAFNADEYVIQGKTVHIPQAGRPSGVTRNRGELPASVSRRTDDDLTFDLDEYTTNPVHIPHADTVELSYDKRESVLRQDKLALMDEVAKAMIAAWWPETATASTGPSFGKEDVLKLMQRFNQWDMPQEGRYLLVDAVAHAQLLQSLTDSESMAFLACANAETGVLGKLYGFNVMMRSTVADSALSTDDEGNVCPSALAWHEQAVCRALGEVKMFDKENDPTYYGDIYSFLVRCGGSMMRKDGIGVVGVLVGATNSTGGLDMLNGAIEIPDAEEGDGDGAA